MVLKSSACLPILIFLLDFKPHSSQPSPTGTEHVTCFPRQGIVSLNLTKALFKEVAVTPLSCHSTFYLCMWEAHWDILMAPPLLMTSSPSSFIFIFNCIRQLRKKKNWDNWAFVYACARMRMCLCVSQEMQFERKYPEEENGSEWLRGDWKTRYTWKGKELDCVRRKLCFWDSKMIEFYS